MEATTLLFLLMAILVGTVAVKTTDGPYTPTWPSVTKHQIPSWFEEAKFGIYAHWGVYTVPEYGNEWYSHWMYVNGSDISKHHDETYGASVGYKDLIPLFKGEKFNATFWADLYKNAGARYAGPVAEHADGFAMFQSSVSHYNAAEMGPMRDIVKEMSEAVRGNGMKFFASLHHQWLWAWYPTWEEDADTYNPEYQLTPQHGGLYGPKVSGSGEFSHPNTTAIFQKYFLEKTLEVTDQYFPDIMYFDSKWGSTINETYRLDYLAHYYNGAEREGVEVVVTYKNTDLEVGAGVLDFERGGVSDITTPHWQTDDAMGITSWSWVNPPNLKNATLLIGELVDIVSKNGNLLLDIPPRADGSIDPAVEHTLLEIGGWLRTNGAAVYSSKVWKMFGEGPTKITPGSFHVWPIFTDSDFRFTTSDTALFVHAMAWCQKGSPYLVKSLNTSASLVVGSKISKVTLLGSSESVTWKQTADGLSITCPKTQVSPYVNVFQVETDNTAIPYLAWDQLATLVPGEEAILTWATSSQSSCTNATVNIALCQPPHGGNCQHIATRVSNSGSFLWRVPQGLLNKQFVVLYIEATEEPHVNHWQNVRVQRQ